MLPEDLLKFGLIPEFIGRLPVIGAVSQPRPGGADPHPRRAAERAGQAVPASSSSSRTSSSSSPTTRSSAVAEQALLRGTGARGLRAILEEVLLNVMYDLPSRDRHREGRHRPHGRARQGQPDPRAPHRRAARSQRPRRAASLADAGWTARRGRRAPRPTPQPRGAAPARSRGCRSSTMRAAHRTCSAIRSTAYPVIHITGTNGKGSVARMVTALLVESGLTVGTYTSPHLERINERITRNGEPIDDDDLAEALIGAWPQLEELAERRPPAGSRSITAAAFRWFADVAVDVAVIEVGLLGRFDATNVVDGDVAVVTNVGLDHTDVVGDWRRAHRLREGRHRQARVVPGARRDRRPTASRSSRAEGPRELWERDVDFGAESQPRRRRRAAASTCARRAASYEQVFLPLHGAHQGDNAAVRPRRGRGVLRTRACPSRSSPTRFAQVTVPGRFEVDGAGAARRHRRRPQPDRAPRWRPRRSPRTSTCAGGASWSSALLEGRDVSGDARGARRGRRRPGRRLHPAVAPRGPGRGGGAIAARAMGVDAEAVANVSRGGRRGARASPPPTTPSSSPGRLYVAGAARAYLRPDLSSAPPAVHAPPNLCSCAGWRPHNCTDFGVGVRVA